MIGTVDTLRTGDFTYEEFCALLPGKQKGDLIEGVIHVASPENIEANELFLWLVGVIRVFVRRRKLGDVFGSRVACRLNKKNAPEPDILFVANRHRDRIRPRHIAGAADVAMEIVSPESVHRDYHKKRRQYEKFGFVEYWIIDPDKREVHLLRLDTNGKYREIRSRNGVFTSKVIAGFWIDPSWLWQKPLPDELEILQKLLAEE